MADLYVLGPKFDRGVRYYRDRLIEEGVALGLDTESTGLDYWSPDWRLRTVQLASERFTCVFDVEVPEQNEVIREILTEGQQFISHNDADCISVHRHFGIDITDRNLDTKVLAQLLWPGELVSHGLKDLVEQYVGPELGEAEKALHARFRELLDIQPYDPESPAGRARLEEGRTLERQLTKGQIGKGFATIDTYDPAYTQYGGADAHYVRKLFMVLEPMMYKKEVHKAWPDECENRAIATRMTIRGMKVNVKLARSLHSEWSGRLHSALDEFQTEYGCPARSTQKVAALLLTDGVVLTKRTKASKTHPEGQWALGKEIVKELAEEYPDNRKLQLLVEVAENSNVATFLTTLLGFVDSDGRVHPSISTLGTVTGRWSVTQPAVQTVSGNNPCRSIFDLNLSADLGQIEPRIAVGLACERNLIPDLLNGYDVYSAASAVAFGPNYTPAQRKKMKRIILGTLYAAGITTLVRQARYQDGWLDANPQIVGEVRDLWKKTAPAIEEYSKYLQVLPTVRLESGRYVPQDEQRRYKAINSVCQGTARDVLMERMRAISKRYDKYLVMTMHDEVLMDVPVTELPEVASFVRQVMESGYNGIPTPTDIEIFPTGWSGAGVSLEKFLEDGE
jgi:DNA polymerase-1